MPASVSRRVTSSGASEHDAQKNTRYKILEIHLLYAIKITCYVKHEDVKDSNKSGS
ncbi:MAG: hypothetical protein P8H21_02770 [Woeseiaceae bacterium]|nr:hypothetical protein [Woeseiaceae bacterium]